MDQKRFATFNWLPGYFITWLDDHRTLQILGVGNDNLVYRARYFLPGANRNADTPTLTSTGVVDMQETHQMLGM